MAALYVAVYEKAHDSDRCENDERIRAFIAGAALPATIDCAALERLIQRELDLVPEHEYRLNCECAEIAIRIIDEIGCKTVLLGNINPVCALAHRYANMLCEKHEWAAVSYPFDLHQVLTSIIFTACDVKSGETNQLLARVLLDEMEPCGHWEGFRHQLEAAVGRNHAEEMIILVRAMIIADLEGLEEWDCVIAEGEPPHDVIFKSGPHFPE
ncbi:MAG TPA: hypothetical protein VIS99_11560 [Terrimicrobiaceae bacterium]